MDWLYSAAGRELLRQESRLAGIALERIFGDQIVQIGSWGKPGALLAEARTQYSVVLGCESEPGTGARVSPRRLGVRTDSVDAVLLPHTLELYPDPHAILREVHRILRPDGKLIVLGFNPASWWGLRHQVAMNGHPTGVRRQISARRLADWLRLLRLRIDSVSPCYASPAKSKLINAARRTGLFASCYLMLATKETIPLTVIRPKVHRRARLVGSLVNPTTRNVA